MKSKEQKRDEAEERQAIYNNLTTQQKLDKLNDGEFAAKKERIRKGFPSALESRWDKIDLSIAKMENN